MIKRKICPFCNQQVNEKIYGKIKNPECQYTINGDGTFRTKQYFHKTCFELERRK